MHRPLDSTSSQAWRIARATQPGRAPSSRFASAAAFFTRTIPRINSGTEFTVTPEMGKFSIALNVWMPYQASSGTSRSPSRSVSVRDIAFLSELSSRQSPSKRGREQRYRSHQARACRASFFPDPRDSRAFRRHTWEALLKSRTRMFSDESLGWGP